MLMESLFVPVLLSLAAGLSTAIGGLVPFFLPSFDKRGLAFVLGFSAGVMLIISFVDLLPGAIDAVGFEIAGISFFIGMLGMLVIDFLVPHTYEQEKHDQSSLKHTSMLVALGIAIHNAPEGLAVLFSGLSSIEQGVLLAFAIGLHNLPEGISVAAPFSYDAKNKKIGFYYALTSGLVEPTAALLGGILLLPVLSPSLIGALLAVAAGAMVFISVDELIPTAHEYVCEIKNYTGHTLIAGILFGMMVMMLGIWILR